MRLIDADALKENCYKQMDKLMESTSEHLSAEALSLLCGFTLIDSAPSIDIEPKRGEWIDMGDFEQCSVCKGTHLKEFQSYYGKTTWIKTPYCPNCGADMREREGE